MVIGTSYSVTSSAGGCTSLPSSSFSISSQLPVPSVPTIATTSASCSSPGTATISNYNASESYTFSPSGPTAGAGGVISGMVIGTSYSVTSSAGGCTSLPSSSFSISSQLPVPSVPTIATTSASCSSPGTATISNYNASESYTFSPSGPTVGAGGVISGMVIGTSYSVTSSAGGCTSLPSSSFSISSQLPTPIFSPTIVSNICPATTVDIQSINATNLPIGTTLTWHSATPASSANLLTNINTLPAGTYYAAFHDANANCYSATSALTVNITPCISLALGTIACDQTQIVSTPVAGTPGQHVLVVRVNVTQTGVFTPVTISGSGMSLANGLNSIVANNTGSQTFYIPMNYDGSPLSTLTFTINGAGGCNADLTISGKTIVSNILSINCLPILGPVLR